MVLRQTNDKLKKDVRSFFIGSVNTVLKLRKIYISLLITLNNYR